MKTLSSCWCIEKSSECSGNRKLLNTGLSHHISKGFIKSNLINPKMTRRSFNSRCMFKNIHMVVIILLYILVKTLVFHQQPKTVCKYPFLGYCWQIDGRANRFWKCLMSCHCQPKRSCFVRWSVARTISVPNKNNSLKRGRVLCVSQDLGFKGSLCPSLALSASLSLCRTADLLQGCGV